MANYVITYVDITSTSECSFELDLRKCTQIEKKKEERKIIPITIHISNRRKMSKYISAVGYSRLLILSLCLFFLSLAITSCLLVEYDNINTTDLHKNLSFGIRIRKKMSAHRLLFALVILTSFICCWATVNDVELSEKK